jgi:hypothetical protein
VSAAQNGTLEHFHAKRTPFRVKKMRQNKRLQRNAFGNILEHVPEKWTRFSDKDMLPKFLNWREFFSIR